ncbi:MAG: hypothetical protein JSV89_01505 [Spirochaetaceae bacterium]|nr:MAG: hypothetical protein JSV89_01505 [Spirochaetaceae bacterium]
MIVYFRKRLNLKVLSEINELIHGKYRKKNRNSEDNEDQDGSAGGSGNQGKLIVNASCAPAEIRYPTDLSLLNEAREKSEYIIDRLHEPVKGKEKKVRTYRKKVRRDYLKAAKRSKLSAKELRKAIGKQLRYLNRDLKHIHGLADRSSLERLKRKEYLDLLVISEVYRQQNQMFEQGVRRIEGRIVSISQPYIRPIVRGEASAPVEFGELQRIWGFHRTN